MAPSQQQTSTHTSPQTQTKHAACHNRAAVRHGKASDETWHTVHPVHMHWLQHTLCQLVCVSVYAHTFHGAVHGSAMCCWACISKHAPTKAACWHVRAQVIQSSQTAHTQYHVLHWRRLRWGYGRTVTCSRQAPQASATHHKICQSSACPAMKGCGQFIAMLVSTTTAVANKTTTGRH